MLATPRTIACGRCQSARSQAVMARVRHVVGRDDSEWTCPECHAVWVAATQAATEFVGDGRDEVPLPARVCPCPLGGPLQRAREVSRATRKREWLWVCAGCGAGHPIGRLALE
jgi:hypothetical protein